jgi:hypothetical protein
MAITRLKKTFYNASFFYSLVWWVDNTFDMQSNIIFALFLTYRFDTCASKGSKTSNLLPRMSTIFLAACFFTYTNVASSLLFLSHLFELDGLWHVGYLSSPNLFSFPFAQSFVSHLVYYTLVACLFWVQNVTSSNAHNSKKP